VQNNLFGAAQTAMSNDRDRRQIGGYRSVSADQPKSLSVIGIQTDRVPYRRLFASVASAATLGASRHSIQLCAPTASREGLPVAVGHWPVLGQH
jgi:hypothetical protein